MYLQCSKYTFLSNFTQTIYRWIYCIKKNCVADTKWVFVLVHCITLTKTCLIMPEDEGNGKKKWNKNPKQNWKTLKTTKQGGLPASVRPPRTSVLTWRLAQVLHPEGNRCGDEAQSPRHFPRSQWTVSPRWQTRAHPRGRGSGKIGRLHTMDSDELMFSSWKSPGKIHKSNSHDLQMSFTELASDFAKWATCSECQNSPSRVQVRGPEKHFIPQGSIRERLVPCAF